MTMGVDSDTDSFLGGGGAWRGTAVRAGGAFSAVCALPLLEFTIPLPGGKISLNI